MKKLRILALVREGLVPGDSLDGYSPDKPPEWKMEYDVVVTLRELGHEVQPLGVLDDLAPLRQSLLEWKPDVTFMMLEEFHGVTTYDQAIVSYLELMQQHYTGCNPRGLLLTHDKALSKKVLQYHRIPTPRFVVYPPGRKILPPPRRMKYPILVKSTVEDSSFGISQASVVTSDKALVERVEFMHEHSRAEAIAEEYIDGRELYVGVMGNERLQSFPVWEMHFHRMPEDLARIATARVKWNAKYQQKHGIETRAAEALSSEQQGRLSRLCKRVYRVLHMSGYGRIDLRLRDDGEVFVLEANANPNLSCDEDFAESAHAAGITYSNLLKRIINLGLNYKAPWRP
jgi:D-alanine-D-alanine ligase